LLGFCWLCFHGTSHECT